MAPSSLTLLILGGSGSAHYSDIVAGMGNSGSCFLQVINKFFNITGVLCIRIYKFVNRMSSVVGNRRIDRPSVSAYTMRITLHKTYNTTWVLFILTNFLF